MGLWNDATGMPTAAGARDAASQYANGLLMGTTAPQFRAYHGSPHSFDRFDASKIGTGEGAQAYGHGLYFAENPKVAEEYRAATSVNATPVLEAQEEFYRSYRQLQQNLNADKATYEAAMADHKVASDALQKARKENSGHTYEVNIAANPEHFLDWDKPLSEQSRHVQDKIQNLQSRGMLPRGWTDEDMATVTGGQLYQELNHKAGTSANSAGLLAEPLPGTDNGIPGIRYLDQGSRAAGEGTYNHVIFDPATIEILRKYGIAGLMGGGAAAAGAQGGGE